MSLEQALAENTATMKQLIAALVGRTSAVELDTRTVAQHTADTAKTETRYFHEPKSRTVYKVGPTDSLNGLQNRPGVVEITEAQYIECKAAYDKIADELLAQKQASGNVSAAPGPTEVAAAPAQAAEPSTAAQPPAPTSYDWDKDVLPALKKLAVKPGDAGATLKKVTADHGATMVPQLKSKCAADGYAALMAAVQAAL